MSNDYIGLDARTVDSIHPKAIDDMLTSFDTPERLRIGSHLDNWFCVIHGKTLRD